MSERHRGPDRARVDGAGSIPHGYYAARGAATGVVLLPAQERHDPGEHPENIRRLPPVSSSSRAWDGLGAAVRARAALRPSRGRAALPRRGLRRAAARRPPSDAPVWLDTDTRVSPGSFDHCLLATGAALTAVDAVAMEAYHRPDALLDADAAAGSPHRPRPRDGLLPAQPRLDRGALRAGRLRASSASRSSTGTSTTATARRRSTGTTPRSSFVSLHQWPLYPGTGWLDETGGARRGGPDGQPADAARLGRPRVPRGARPRRAAGHRGVRARSCCSCPPARTGTPPIRCPTSSCPSPASARWRRAPRRLARRPGDRARRRARGRLQRLDAAGARPRDRRRPRRLRRDREDDIFVPARRAAAGRVDRSACGRDRRRPAPVLGDLAS